MAQDDRELVGIGGWLLFFLLALGLFSPVAMIGRLIGLLGDPSIAAAFGEAWAPLRLVELALVALSVALAWFLVWRLLYRRSWTSVQMIIVGIWLLTIGGLFLEIAAVCLMISRSMRE